MKKAISLLLILVLLLPTVFADGMVMIIDDKDMWGFHPETQQTAFIRYNNGIEKMLISVDIDANINSEKAVWLFPVPSTPEYVEIDIMKGFPMVYGSDIDREFNDGLNVNMLFIMGYSTFPIGLPVLYFESLFRGSFNAMSEGTIGFGKGSVDGVTIHQTVEMMGLTSELVTAENEVSFNNYLKEKGLDLPLESRIAMRDYIGEKYSFVVSYITDIEKYKNEIKISDYAGVKGYSKVVPLGVVVNFPTEKIYFPLKPTKVYGALEIPIIVYVEDYVSPNLYKSIKKDTEITYYKENSFYVPNELKEFFDGQNRIRDMKYTKIKIDTESENLDEDLWIKDSAPIFVAIKDKVLNYLWIFGIFLFILCSMIASLFAGKVVFRKHPLSNRKLMFFGLWNCFTLIGFLIALTYMKTRRLDPEIEQKIKEEGMGVVVKDSRKICFFFLFYLFFFILVFSFSFLLKIIL